MDFNIADVEEAVAATMPDREVIVCGDRRFSWREFDVRSGRLATWLRRTGLGCHVERAALAPHESGQDHLGLYLHNGPEYLEGMFGAYKARVAPFNVNWRYVASELEYLLVDAAARALVYNAEFAPQLAEVLPALPQTPLLLQVADGSGNELLPGAVDYEAALASADPADPDPARSPDDLYILYTGGTTGMPKGVLWRQADAFAGALGGWRGDRTRREWQSVAEIVESAVARPGARTLAAPPFMHGSGHWPACRALFTGGTVVIPSSCRGLDPDAVWRTVESEAVNVLVIVGDAFARPLLESLRRRSSRPRSLRFIVNGGAILTSETRAALVAELPGITVIDTMGSSESGSQAHGRVGEGEETPSATFVPYPGTVVIDEDRRTVLPPGHDRIGWLATTGRIPLGYLGDAEKTAATFAIVDGRRMTIPGDRARHRTDGLIEVLGRDSVTINSGGEKVFAEEVEGALLAHPAVLDTTVVGRPSERWGSEVVAVVQLRPGASAGADELLAAAATRLARYKLPKDIVFVDDIQRSPAGKADYRWARQVAMSASARSS